MQPETAEERILEKKNLTIYYKINKHATEPHKMEKYKLPQRCDKHAKPPMRSFD